MQLLGKVLNFSSENMNRYIKKKFSNHNHQRNPNQNYKEIPHHPGKDGYCQQSKTQQTLAGIQRKELVGIQVSTAFKETEKTESKTTLQPYNSTTRHVPLRNYSPR